MKMIKTFLFSVALLASACVRAEDVVGERAFDLGFGFRYVLKDIPYHSGIDHYSFLYFKRENLGMTSRYSVAPSGRFAAFQANKTGEIFLFDVVKNELRQPLSGRIEEVREFEWSESEKCMKLIFRMDGSVRLIPFDR